MTGLLLRGVFRACFAGTLCVLELTCFVGCTGPVNPVDPFAQYFVSVEVTESFMERELAPTGRILFRERIDTGRWDPLASLCEDGEGGRFLTSGHSPESFPLHDSLSLTVYGKKDECGEDVRVDVEAVHVDAAATCPPPWHFASAQQVGEPRFAASVIVKEDEQLCGSSASLSYKKLPLTPGIEAVAAPTLVVE